MSRGPLDQEYMYAKVHSTAHSRSLRMVPEFRFKSYNASQDTNGVVSRRCCLALPEHNLPSLVRKDRVRKVDVRRARTVPVDLEVIVDHDVREHRFQLVGSEEASGATWPHRTQSECHGMKLAPSIKQREWGAQRAV